MKIAQLTVSPPVLGCLLVCILAGCASTPSSSQSGQAPDQTTALNPPEDSREMTDGRALLLFPINLVPDILSNTVLFLFNPLASLAQDKAVSNIWPIVSIISPIMGPVCGWMDAAAGYPFWLPVALDEKRDYSTPRTY